MSIYIQLENLATDETKRLGPFEAVSPGDTLFADSGDGWTGPWVARALDETEDVRDENNEPYSWVERVRVEGEPPVYWHNCYVVQGEEQE